MSGQRIALGVDAEIVSECDDGIELEGRVKLRPGRDVEVSWPSSNDDPTCVRRGLVWQWSLTAWGRGGPSFRGFCRWT